MDLTMSDEYILPLPSAPSKPSKIRFKSKAPQDYDISESSSHKHSSSSQSRHHHHRRHHHNHPSKRRHALPFERSLSPNTAFRESLFDAMADDEGAAFWEGVYGQPIHTYSPHIKTPEGELEKMTDEAYVAYVRRKMWERSHEYVVEERKRRDQQRDRKRKRRDVEEKKEWESGIEQALKRGEERRRAREWKHCWLAYERGWERLQVEQETLSEEKKKKNNDNNDSTGPSRDRISWPVESGSWKDVQPEHIERFFKHAPQPTSDAVGHLVPIDLGALLKAERVRWHPDKIQQRFRGQGIELDEKTMKIVTAVFQVVDHMWTEARHPSGGGGVGARK